MGVTLENILQMVEGMPGNFMIFQEEKKELKVLYYTDGIPKLTGFTKEEYQQVPNFYELVIEEDRHMMQKRIKEGLEDETMQDMDMLLRLKHKVKGVVWGHIVVKRYRLENHQEVYIANVLDVTKETMISYALMDASDRYICVIEKATKRFLYANDGFYDLIDSNPADAMGKHCYELLCKVMEMKDNDNCLCYSGINADPPLEYYNPKKKKYLTLTGREINWGEYNSYVFYLTDITEKKEREEALEDSQKRFNVALDNSELMIWEYDMVNNRCINSEKAGRDYNIPLVIENYPESLFETGHTPPETIEQIKDVKRRLENGETGFSVERRTIRNDGTSEWQKVDYTLECDANGKPLRAIICGIDITEKKELEQKYEEQMSYRNRFAENAMFSVRLDLEDNQILDYTANHPILESMVKGVTSASELLETFFTTSVFKDDSEVTKEKLTRESLKITYALGRSQYQTTYRCKLLGVYLDLNLTMYKNPGNDHLEVFYVITDVTDLILKQSALESVVNKDYDIVILIDNKTEKMKVLAHSEFAILPEQSKEHPDDYDTIMLDFAQKHKSSYYTEEDFHAVSEGIRLEIIRERLEESPVYEFNCRTVGLNDHVHTFRLSFAYLNEGKKEIIFTRTNITGVVQEERHIQAELEDALRIAKKADQAKTDFLSRMSHDMRTPMNGIIGMTELTQDMKGLSAEAQNNLAAIKESSIYLLQLINDTLDMNKIESNRFHLNPAVVNAEELVEGIIGAVTPMAEQKQIDLQFVPINVELEYIRVDGVRVKQLFINLLSNAVKFTPAGGKVKLIVECKKRENGIAYDRIVVEDNGRGMSKSFLEHIFEPFSQERNEIVKGEEGTGLGMSIVKNLVEQMNGSIEIESKLEKGTKVTVYLNFERVFDVEEKEPVKPTIKQELFGKRVLLVEDHPLNATISRKLLEKKGIIVEQAENGEKAVAKFAESKPGYYDVILMDIRMPVLNGLEATKRIRSSSRKDGWEIPIVAMTANAYDDDVKKSLDAGMNAHLAKPVEPERMYTVIGEVLSRRDDFNGE